MEAITGRVRELIEGSNFCFIGTIRKDGTAHVHPVWIGIERDTLLVNTAEGRIWPGTCVANRA
jgi:predicted pyridoxine 5'-phosphate oxidase superfamily flavin-nucleotide-binding protein